MQLEENEEYILFTKTSPHGQEEERSFPLSLNATQVTYPSDYINKNKSKPIVVNYHPMPSTKTHDDVARLTRAVVVSKLLTGANMAVQSAISFLHKELSSSTARVEGDWKSNNIDIASDKDVIGPLDLLHVAKSHSFILEGTQELQYQLQRKRRMYVGLDNCQ